MRHRLQNWLLLLLLLLPARVEAQAGPFSAQIQRALASIGFVGGVLGPAGGGTGIATYTAGDLLCASAATTFTTIAGVATGQVFSSGGVGLCGTWTADPAVTTLTANRPGIATTSTDGLVLANATAATAGVSVQQSPRLRFRSNVWNTTSVANNTDDWFIESVPVNGATPSGLLKFGKSLNGAAVTYPMTLTSDAILATGGVGVAGTLRIYGSQGTGTGAFTTIASSLGNTTLTGGNGSGATGNIFTVNSVLSLGANQDFLWTGRTTHSSSADGLENITNATKSAGIGFDVATDALLKIRTRAQTGDAGLTALTLAPSQPQITLGTHATSVIAGELRTVVYKATVTATTCLAPFAAATLTADCTIATIPAKGKIIAVYADTTAGWTCSGTCTGTKVLVLGKSAGGTEYLASNTVATTPVVRGEEDAELGTELVASARIQGGAIVNWSATTTVTARFTSGTGNWGDGATTFVNAGSTTFYIETVVYP